jgi:ribosomal-protein-alanine N-acetyltransferase
MKTIVTPRLILRRLMIEDYDRLFAEFSDDDARKFLGMNTEEAFQSFKTKYYAGLENYRTSFLSFQLIEKSSAQVIGDCSYHTWYKAHNRAEIGYGLSVEAYKRQGFMTEALQVILDYGFAEMKLHRIEALIGVSNIASQKLVNKFGFVQEGLLRQHYYTNGIYEDSLVYGILKNDFKYG